jgi:hypothetical protein
MVGIPTYYADHLDIIEGLTGFDIAALGLDRPGLKVLDFHPNIVYLNAPADDFYAGTKTFYHDADRLLAARHKGRGARTLLLDLLAHIASRRLPTASAGAINALWRGVGPTERPKI